MKNGIRRWSSITTEEFVDMADSIALLPVSAVEQHGPHLPLGVDALINEAIVTKVMASAPEGLSVLVLPQQFIGYSAEHSSFPGTLSFSIETLLSTWCEIGESVAKAGLRKLVIFNSHGGQNELMTLAARELRISADLFVAAASWTHLIDLEDLVTPHERRFGIHGGAIETALMLHIAPEEVKKERIDKFISKGQAVADVSTHLQPTGRNTYAWMTEDLNKTGAVGDASQATPSMGEEILDRAVKGLIEFLYDVNRISPHSS